MRFQGVCLVEKYLFMHEKMTFLGMGINKYFFNQAHIFQESHFLMHKQIFFSQEHTLESPYEFGCGQG